MDVSKCEAALGPGQVKAGPSLYATPDAPLPQPKEDPAGNMVVAPGFAYTPQAWSSASASGVAHADDGCGAALAHHAAKNEAATLLPGIGTAARSGL